MGIPMTPDESINPTPIDRERRKNLQARGVIESLIHLHAIASSSKLSLNEKIENTLELGSAHLKLPIAILGRVSGDHLTVEQVISPDSEPNSGATFPLEDTYSVLAMGTNKPIGFHNIGQSKLKKNLAYQDRRYECYLGIRIDIDTKPYGTLSFVDHTPRDEPFSGADYAFLQLLGTWISGEISRSLSEERFRRAIDSLQEGFALFDADDRLVTFNEEYIRFHEGIQDLIKPGISFEELCRANVMRGLNATAIGWEENYIQKRLKDRKSPTSTPITQQKSNGEWFIYWESRTPDGGLVATYTNITSLKTIEDKLRTSQERLDAALEAANEILWDWQLQDGDFYIDPRLEVQLGYPKGTLSPHISSWNDLIHPDDKDHYQQTINRHIAL